MRNYRVKNTKETVRCKLKQHSNFPWAEIDEAKVLEDAFWDDVYHVISLKWTATVHLFQSKICINENTVEEVLLYE